MKLPTEGTIVDAGTIGGLRLGARRAKADRQTRRPGQEGSDEGSMVDTIRQARLSGEVEMGGVSLGVRS